ncbi:MAG: hypothetical protein ACI9YR_002931, partial [Bacteroidia bacterium]
MTIMAQTRGLLVGLFTLNHGYAFVAWQQDS